MLHLVAHEQDQTDKDLGPILLANLDWAVPSLGEGAAGGALGEPAAGGNFRSRAGAEGTEDQEGNEVALAR